MAKKEGLYIPEGVIREILRAKAHEVADDIKKYTDTAISRFYADYTPITHKNRALDYHNVWGIKRPYELMFENLPNGIRVIFDFDPAFIIGHHNPDIIFEGPFEQGYHGGPIRTSYSSDEDNVPTGSFTHIKRRIQFKPAPKMSPSPWEMIKDYVDHKYKA